MLALGTAVLLERRDLWDRLRDDPSSVDAIVEELLRILAVVQVAFPRFAKTDVVVGGVPISEGSVVLVSLPPVNRDPRSSAGDEIDLGAGQRLAPGLRLRLPPLRRRRAGPDGAAPGLPAAGSRDSPTCVSRCRPRISSTAPAAWSTAWRPCRSPAEAPVLSNSARRGVRSDKVVATVERGACAQGADLGRSVRRAVRPRGPRPQQSATSSRSVASMASSRAPITEARSPSAARHDGGRAGAGQDVAPHGRCGPSPAAGRRRGPCRRRPRPGSG